MHFENGVTRISEDVLLDPDGLPHVLALTLSTLLLEHSFMIKSHRVGGGGWVVAYKILLSAPVPIGIGIRGLGLGLDNIATCP